MRVVFMGTPDFAVPPLRALSEAGHEIACVYTQPPRPAGRGKRPRPGPVHAAAEKMSLEVRHPTTLRDETAQRDFAALDADVAVVVAYGLILPRTILDAPRRGCLNIHASLLPRWRGAAPIHRAVLAGDAETGICIMRMDAGLDTGPVLARAAVPIGVITTTGDLHDALSDLGARMIVETLPGLDTLSATPQAAEGITYAEKIDKAEARIDWSAAAEHVDRQIRGLSPFPGAWCDIAGERVKLLRSRVVDGTGAPGETLSGFTVACGTGAIEVLGVQRAGRRPVAASEALRGMTLPDRIG